MLLMCYFLPSLLTLFNVVNPEESKLYHVASRYFLPASLILFTLSIDLPGIFRLGPKALIMFLTGTLGVVIGGPLAILLVGAFNPELVGGDTWRGLSTVAGSWIGGGANQVAMQTINLPESGPDSYKSLFSVMVAVDVLVAEFWMIFLLIGVGKAKQIDKFFGADASSIDELQQKMGKVQQGSRTHSFDDRFGCAYGVDLRRNRHVPPVRRYCCSDHDRVFENILLDRLYEPWVKILLVNRVLNNAWVVFFIYETEELRRRWRDEARYAVYLCFGRRDRNEYGPACNR